MQTLRGGRPYRVTGANKLTGEDVEITVEAFDEADAARAANRQGVFVSGCVAAGSDGSTWAGRAPSAAAPPIAPGAVAPPAAGPAAPGRATTFAEAVARDPVVQRLVRAHPKLALCVSRLNREDRNLLSDLVGEPMGISYRDSAHVGNLMKEADQWEPT